jgi:hypothetical protein
MRQKDQVIRLWNTNIVNCLSQETQEHTVLTDSSAVNCSTVKPQTNKLVHDIGKVKIIIFKYHRWKLTSSNNRFTFQEKTLDIHWICSRVKPRGSLNAVRTQNCRDWNHCRPLCRRFRGCLRYSLVETSHISCRTYVCKHLTRNLSIFKHKGSCYNTTSFDNFCHVHLLL